MRLKLKLKKVSAMVVAIATLVEGGFAGVNAYALSTETKYWNTYYSSPSAYVTAANVNLVYRHYYSHYAQATSITGTATKKQVVLTGTTIQLYDVASSGYVSNYTIDNTSTVKHFRPYPRSGEPGSTNILVTSTSANNGTYYTEGKIWY